MPPEKLRHSSAIAVATGCGLATAWYAASSMLLSGISASLIPAAGAIALAGIVPMIPRKRKSRISAEQSYLSMSQRLEALNKHASINIVNEQDELTEVNDGLLDLTGYSREELIGEQVRILYDTPVQNVADEVRSYLVRGMTWQGETQLRRKDGSMLFTQSTIMPLFNEVGEWAGSISARTDVTRTHKLISNQHTTQTLDELLDDIWIVDSDTEKFIYMNRAAKDRFLTNDEDYQDSNLVKLNSVHEIEEVLLACRALRDNCGSTAQLESKLLGVPMQVSIKFLPGAKESGRYLVLFNNISDRIEQEKQKSAFISTVSHELRSPLTSIKGAMGLLLSGSAGELPDRALGLLEIAHRNADRLVLIINDILDLDKISSGEMDFDLKEIDLVELVKETHCANAMLQQRFGVEVKVVGADQPVVFQTDPNRIIQVLTNLLSNAYKFAPPNSDIIISIDNATDYVRISVQNGGPGIPLDEQHKIFDRFADMTNSDRASKGGTGLGLNICKAIIERLGGTIGFDTEVGVGTTFYFNLPKKQPVSVFVDEVATRNIA